MDQCYDCNINTCCVKCYAGVIKNDTNIYCEIKNTEGFMCSDCKNFIYDDNWRSKIDDFILGGESNDK